MVIIQVVNEDNLLMFILRVNSLNCCKDCPIKIQKALSRLDGVHSVSVDAKKKLVHVTGEMDPMILVDKINKMGKTAKLVNGNLKNKQAVGKESSSSDDQLKKKKKVRFEGDSCCREEDINDARPPRQSRGRRRDDDHEAEDYDCKPRDFDREICRDRYCWIHRRDPLMGDHPLMMHGRGPLMFSNGPFINAGYFGPRPRPPMTPFVAYGPRMMIPPPPMSPFVPYGPRMTTTPPFGYY